MSDVIGEVYSSDLFTWDKTSKCLISDMSLVPGCLRTLFRNDMSVGFGIRSSRTQNIAYFTLSKIDRDQDGDVVYWRFDSHEDCSDPRLVDVHVLIFNT